MKKVTLTFFDGDYTEITAFLNNKLSMHIEIKARNDSEPATVELDIDTAIAFKDELVRQISQINNA